MRFGDMLNIRVDNFRYYKDDKGKEDRSKECGSSEWKKFQERVSLKFPNIISFNIYKK